MKKRNRREFLAAAAVGAGATLLPREVLAFMSGPVEASSPAWREFLDRNSNPYLSGNYAPVHEEVTVDDLEVVGTLPEDLSGMFVRNGPNPQHPPSGRYHWFDGDGMLHGVRVQDGRASYRNRYIRTFGYEKEKLAGESIWTGLTEMPNLQDPPFGRMFKNTGNTALVWHDDRLLALNEGGNPHEIRVPSLETVGEFDYDGELQHAFTAHPKVDEASREMMFFGYNVMGPNFLEYSVASPEGKLIRTVPIELQRGVMMHDFAITAKHTVFMDLPLIFNPMRLAQGEAPFFFDREQVARFGILPRHGDNADVRWFETPSCYVFHNLNAWDEGDEVVLVGCRMEETSVATPPGHSTQYAGHSSEVQASANREDWNQDESARLHQWRFNLATGEVRETALDDRASDFPRLNPSFQGRKCRYGYAALFVDAGAAAPKFDRIVKHDLETGSSATFSCGAGRFAGEAVFVARPGGSAEDDGWLVTLLHDENENRSEFLVIDAQTMSDEPVARVLLPARVPYGFHGDWIAGRHMA